MEAEYLEFKVIESSLNGVLKEAPANSDLDLFQKSFLPYLELLQDFDPSVCLATGKIDRRANCSR